MPGWRTVRVFISSTFRDMHAERDHLVKVVFPALRERLEKHRIHLIDIDLRWGVTREQAENDRVLELCLQQIDECRPFFIGILGERYGWLPTRLPGDALKKFGWLQHHTGKSVTELEILHGVMQNPAMRGRALFCLRDPNCLRAVPEKLCREVFDETDDDRKEKLADLRRRIRHSGHPVFDNYPAQWDPEAFDRVTHARGRLVDLAKFGDRVRDFLWSGISEEHQLLAAPAVESAVDPLAEEQDYHDRFIDARLRVYVGREAVNEALRSYADGDEPHPCLVTGPSGSGKTAAMAHFVRSYGQADRLVAHFIGASPRSTSVREMLRRFCLTLKAGLGEADEVPQETARLIVTFRELLGKVPTTQRLVFVIDALNQLDETDRAQWLEWLPVQLPPHVKIIVSCISDSGNVEPALQAFEHRKHRHVPIGPLTPAECREIIRQVPSLSAKALDEEQIRLLLKNQAATNPLFLLVALEELRGFAPYERLNERIIDLPQNGDTVTAIFTQMLKRLEEDFTPDLVRAVLRWLGVARRGLSDRELLDLVEGPSVKLEDSTSDLFPILRQLRPYLQHRGTLWDFFHRNLDKAVREHADYLRTEESQSDAHARLAKYFGDQHYFLESLDEQRARAKRLPPTPRPANIRKVNELPYQLLQVAKLSGKDNPKSPHWDAVADLFTDLHFLEAKAEAQT
jgi:telomerase protein component 1